MRHSPQVPVSVGGADTMGLFAIRPDRRDSRGYGGSPPRETTVSSQEEGFPVTRHRNQTRQFVSEWSLSGMQGEFLDHRVGQQLAGKLLHGRPRGAVGRPVELNLKPLSLAHAGHVAEAETV